MQELIPGVYTFSGLIAGRVYGLKDTDGWTLVDTSISNAGRKILAQLQQAGYQPSDVKRILITHAHPDHVGSLPMLQAVTGAEVWCHALEKPVIEGKESIARRPSGARPPDTRLSPTPVRRTVSDQEVLPLLGGLQVIATPGHAPGHISLWLAEQRLMITGDVIFHLFNRMTEPLAFLTVDAQENRRSIQKVLRLKPQSLLFGHGQALIGNAAAPLEAFARRIGVQ